MFDKVLIANRGEIALRVIRACHEMGIKTVAVFSTADADSLHVRFADEAVCIGPPLSKESYLNIPRLIGAAEVTGADAIHPGYGFLAENAKFAEICEDSDITFIGATADTISKMGNKALARQTMTNAGVPIIHGSEGVLDTEKEALDFAKKIGFPVILKASSGGGGKGMRIVRNLSELSRLFAMAKVEAETAFGDGDLYLERYLERPRHIEVQIMGYADGTILTFGERDCSIQRRHQKLIEESPSPDISDGLREKLSHAAIIGAKAVNYVGAGTFEFLVEGDEFFFMEMNTRIQVEHTVSEQVFRVDLLVEQIRAAAGEKPIEGEIRSEGHAIEVRINAENPDKGFIPSPGQITAFHVPGGMGIRVDTHAYAGYHIPPFYDSMIAKLIAFGNDRKQAISRMRRALSEFTIEGVDTTIPLHQKLFFDKNIVSGQYNTNYLEQFLTENSN